MVLTLTYNFGYINIHNDYKSILWVLPFCPAPGNSPTRGRSVMLSVKFGRALDGPLSSIVQRVNVNPNTVTIAGCVITTIAAITLSVDLFLGGILILIGGIFDMLDGVIARAHNKATRFGAFLDSVLDRYSDALLLMGFSLYFLKQESVTGLVISVGTMIGALIISYVKARAEGLGERCDTGIMERPERIILMAVGALTGWIFPIMWIMLVLTHLTVLQRVLHVKKEMG